jgi:hypothetical protein
MTDYIYLCNLLGKELRGILLAYALLLIVVSLFLDEGCKILGD